MEDEAKLKFFTGTLPGHEAGRRVPVNVVIAGSHELKSTSLSPPFPKLRITTSDVSLRKSKWDGPERCSQMTLDWALRVPPPSHELSGNLVVGNPHSAMKTPRPTATSNFGVIGDGRFQASSHQKNRPLVQSQATPNGQSLGQKLTVLDSATQPNLQARPISKGAETCNGGESFISQCEDSDFLSASVPETTPPVRRSRSFSNSIPWASSESDSAYLRRVSKPVISLTASLASRDLEETSQPLAAQSRLQQARSALDPSVPPCWTRGGPPFTAIHSHQNQNVTAKQWLSGSRFDPESFTLPFGVSLNLADFDSWLIGVTYGSSQKYSS